MKFSYRLSGYAFAMGVIFFFILGPQASAQTNCVSPPPGLVGWWRGEGNLTDQIGTNHGTLVGNTTFGVGRVGQALVFDGDHDAVSVGSPPELRLQTLTIEAWIKRSSATLASLAPWQSGDIFGCAWGGYTLGLWDDGRLLFGKVGYSSVSSVFAITDTNTFHHVAVTKSGSNVVLYVDGVAQSVGPYDPGFVFGGTTAIGARGDDYATSFLGSVDEVSVYNRALSTTEVQAIHNAGSGGKCVSEEPESIVTNGGLELLPGDTFRTVLPGSSYAGWRSVGTGDIEFDATYFQPKGQGLGCVDLNGVAYQGAIAQTLMNEPGVFYRLRFAMSGNPGAPGENKRGDKTTAVYWGGTNVATFVFQHLPDDTWSNMRWEYHEILVNGTGADELRFTSKTEAYNDAGPVIDDISVVRVPNPALSIISQPASQVVSVGDTVTFNVDAFGMPPLTYQWQLYGTNLSGATASSLVLTNVQFADAGIYSVVVSNSAASVASSNAVLTVNPLPPCAPPPAGLVGWWKAEGSTLNQTGVINGTLAGNTSFGPGRVGQAFMFDGNGDGVTLGNPPALQLQNFTIEAWVKRSSSSAASLTPWGGLIFSCPYGGYGLGMMDNGSIYLSKVGYSFVSPTFVITDTTNFHHLAVTKVGGTVVFYLDGVAETAGFYDPGFVFGGFMAIGARGDDLVGSFLGAIDEVSVYRRALSVTEVQAIYNAGSSGKCGTGVTNMPIELINVNFGGHLTPERIGSNKVGMAAVGWTTNDLWNFYSRDITPGQYRTDGALVSV